MLWENVVVVAVYRGLRFCLWRDIRMYYPDRVSILTEENSGRFGHRALATSKGEVPSASWRASFWP